MTCPYCNQEAKYGPNEEYYGRRFGKSYMCYYCKECDAYVGTHNNTTRPLGTMANRELRKKRMEAHALIDPLWREGKYNRSTVYRRLSDALGRNVHVGESNMEMCEEIIKTVPLIFTPNHP